MRSIDNLATLALQSFIPYASSSVCGSSTSTLEMNCTDSQSAGTLSEAKQNSAVVASVLHGARGSTV